MIWYSPWERGAWHLADSVVIGTDFANYKRPSLGSCSCSWGKGIETLCVCVWQCGQLTSQSSFLLSILPTTYLQIRMVSPNQKLLEKKWIGIREEMEEGKYAHSRVSACQNINRSFYSLFSGSLECLSFIHSFTRDQSLSLRKALRNQWWEKWTPPLLKEVQSSVGTKQCTDHYRNKPITCQLWVCACLFSKLFSALPLICCISSTLWLSGQFSRRKALARLEDGRRGKATSFSSLTTFPLDGPGYGSSSHHVASPPSFQGLPGHPSSSAPLIFFFITPPDPGMAGASNSRLPRV